MRGTRTSIVVLLAAGALAGCGSSHDSQPGLTQGQAQGLTAQLEAARVAAAARDVAGTRAALVKFRSSVARLQRDGALSADTARALRTGAQRIVRRVTGDSSPPPQPVTAGPPATSTSTSPVPAPPAPGPKKKHEDKKKGEKHGHGEGGD